MDTIRRWYAYGKFDYKDTPCKPDDPIRLNFDTVNNDMERVKKIIHLLKQPNPLATDDDKLFNEKVANILFVAMNNKLQILLT